MKALVKPIWLTDKGSSPAERTQTCVILAGGPSLRHVDLEYVISKCRNIITINDSWRLLPTGIDSVKYFCDESWWSMQLQKNPRSIDGFSCFHDSIYRGMWFTGSTDSRFIDHPQVNVLNLTGQRGLELDPSGLRHGSNSGYQAINLAVHLGAQRIVLLGYDMKVEGSRTNWHDEPRLATTVYQQAIAQSMLPHFPSLIEPLKEIGVDIVNATQDSELTCFPSMTIKGALTPDAFKITDALDIYGDMLDWRS